MNLMTDRGGEINSRHINDFCEENIIKRHLTSPNTTQQMGVVDRRNWTLVEMTRSTLKEMKVPNYLWGDAVRPSSYIINTVPRRELENITPYESLREKKPSLDHLRVFGCLAYKKTEAPHLKKLDEKSQPLVPLGIKPGTKTYRLNSSTQKVMVSRDVVFDKKTCWSYKKEPSMDLGMFYRDGEK